MAPGRILSDGEAPLPQARPQPADPSQSPPQLVSDSFANSDGSPLLNGYTETNEPHHMNGHTQHDETVRPNGLFLGGDDSQTESSFTEPRSPLNGFEKSFTNGSLNGDAKPNASMPIAVIGIAVRAGSASTPDEFFEMLSRGRSAFSPEIPPERFNNASFYHPNAGKLGCINTNGASFIQQDITKFDAPFFNITELEATSMDPQQRLLLECAFEALDSAGVQKHTTVGKDIGVFIGAGSPEYEFDLFRDSDTMPMFQATGKSIV